MKSKRRILSVAPLVVLLAGLTWLLLPPPERFFHGKPESYWIERLSDGRWSLAQDQVEQWKEFGPEGVRVLIRALDKADRPLERTYRTAWRKMGSLLPRDWMRQLPSPRSDSTRLTRQSVTDLLWRRLVLALLRAAQRKDSVGSYSKAALKQLESEVAGEQGAQK